MSATRKGKKEFNVDPGRIGNLAEHSTDAVQPQYEQHTTDTLKRYDVRLSPADWERLGAVAKKEGTSKGAIIRRLVRQYLRGVQ